MTDLVAKIKALGLSINPSRRRTSSREMVMTGGNTGMWEWEKGFYSLPHQERPSREGLLTTSRRPRSSRSGSPFSYSKRRRRARFFAESIAVPVEGSSTCAAFSAL